MRLLDSSDKRLRNSWELSEKSRSHVSRSHDLVFRSRELLAQQQRAMLHEYAQHVGVPSENRQADAEEPSTDLLQIVSGQRFEKEAVNMDGKHFIDCELVDCTLEYSGLPVVIESTQFRGSRFLFTGAASLTMRFLECFELLPDGPKDFAISSTSSGPQRPN